MGWQYNDSFLSETKGALINDVMQVGGGVSTFVTLYKWVGNMAILMWQGGQICMT